MSENQNNVEQSVDRRTDTVVTQQPGFASTQHVTYDAAAERRMQTFQLSRIVYTILGLLEILLGLRFVLKLISANPDSGFANFIYGITNVFVAPFVGLTGTPASGGTVLEVNTLIAMVVYALLAWLIVRGGLASLINNYGDFNYVRTEP